MKFVPLCLVSKSDTCIPCSNFSSVAASTSIASRNFWVSSVTDYKHFFIHSWNKKPDCLRASVGVSPDVLNTELNI